MTAPDEGYCNGSTPDECTTGECPVHDVPETRGDVPQAIVPWTKTEWRLEAIGLARENAALRAQMEELANMLRLYVEADNDRACVAAGRDLKPDAVYIHLSTAAAMRFILARAALARVTA